MDDLGTRTDSEIDNFTKCYNKELRVSSEEIPIVLTELVDAAYNYIRKERYEKALLLLDKGHGILDVLNLDNSSRDKILGVIIFQNMAMCYQRQGMLEECAACL